MVSQGPAPSVGSIGMGTLTGEIGVVKTKEARSENVKMKRAESGASGVVGRVKASFGAMAAVAAVAVVVL